MEGIWATKHLCYLHLPVFFPFNQLYNLLWKRKEDSKISTIDDQGRTEAFGEVKKWLHIPAKSPLTNEMY